MLIKPPKLGGKKKRKQGKFNFSLLFFKGCQSYYLGFEVQAVPTLRRGVF